MNGYWNSWYFGWGWFLWFGVVLLLFSSFGNWGYTYRAHRRFDDIQPGNRALGILNERYAKGEISRDEFHRMRSEIFGATHIGEQGVSKADSKKSA